MSLPEAKSTNAVRERSSAPDLSSVRRGCTTGPPIFLWWVAIQFAFLITFFVRPLTFQQLFFTYVIPLLPLLIAWDGAVSNARSYCESDLLELTRGLSNSDYQWEMGVIPEKGGGKVWLMGLRAS